MANLNDRVHILGMSESGSTHLTVGSFPGTSGQEITVEPPINVVFELQGDEGIRVVVAQGGLAARYSDMEICQIGEGSAMLGLNRVIGDIACNGNLQEGATKPLHPTMTDVEPIDTTPLGLATRQLST